MSAIHAYGASNRTSQSGSRLTCQTFSHPDYHRRLRLLTGIHLFDNATAPSTGSRAGRFHSRITAGREFHPAPKVGLDSFCTEYSSKTLECHLSDTGVGEKATSAILPLIPQALIPLSSPTQWGRGYLQGVRVDTELREGERFCRNSD